MQDYQKRVIAEKEDLAVKICKLMEFLEGDISFIDRNDLALLKCQSTAMQTYYEVLRMRIERFK